MNEFDLTENERTELAAAAKEAQNKALRNRYMDAYRKYQAAVNYGQYEKTTEVDAFINSLQGKDWAVLENVPGQLKYFLGEIGFEESGLVKAIKIEDIID